MLQRHNNLHQSNQNYDDWVIGESPLAKKIVVNFAPAIQPMKEKGHPVPKNATGQDHGLSWHLHGKCKADCVQKADHVPSSALRGLLLLLTVAVV